MTTQKKLLTLGVIVGILIAIFSFLSGGIKGKFLGSSATTPRNYVATGKFVTTWKTDNKGASTYKQITIHTNPNIDPDTNLPYVYNYTVDWGDGKTETGVTGTKKHTYDNVGTYTVSISGFFPGFYSRNPSGGMSDSFKLLSVEEWGSNVWKTFERAFEGCENLEIKATDKPDLSKVTNFKYIFSSAKNFNSDISSWDVSHVTDMQGAFYGTAFNKPLNTWDVSNVTNMSQMFNGANAFNQDISNWNVSKVTDMSQMFLQASKFNQPLSGWERTTPTISTVGNVKSMYRMFTIATSFDQSLNSWDVSSVENMTEMFLWASSFNQLLNNWDVSKVTDMSQMFQLANSFNQPLNSWDISNVMHMYGMFSNATSFNQPLDQWGQKLTHIKNMSSMFSGAEAFNQDLSNWDVSKVESMIAMFSGATAFNQPLEKWDISKVTDMRYIFSSATAFNQPLEKWDISNVIDMSGMFGSATSFNQPLGQWGQKLTHVKNMFQMFNGATAFNQDITNWNVSSVENMSGMFANTKIFNQDLSKWERTTPDISTLGNVKQMNEMFHAATIFNRDISNWNVSSVTSMSNMFQSASAFNQPLSGWERTIPTVSTVKNIANMNDVFHLAISFNQDISNWDVSGAKTMRSMFHDARSFNQPIGAWGEKTSNVTDMRHMFNYATSFDQPINAWNVSKVEDMSFMFFYAKIFNQPLNLWNVSNVKNMSSMFQYTEVFNQDLSGWERSGTTPSTVGSVTDMSSMFSGAKVFNQDVSKWNVSKVINMEKMFLGAKIFNGDISSWNISNVTNMGQILTGSAFSMANYHKLLQGWSSLQNVQPDIVIDIPSKYCGAAAVTGHDILTTAPNNWEIHDGDIDPLLCPGTPTNLRATIKDSGHVELTWDASVASGAPAITDYILQYKTAASAWTTYDDGASDSKTATISMAFENNVGYNFRVAAKNINETGSYSSASDTVIIDTILPEITLFKSPSLNNSRTINDITLTATDNVGVTGYKLSATMEVPTTWDQSIPTKYVFPSTTPDGLQEIHAWVKDATGNISQLRTVKLTIDTTAPIVNTFTIPEYSDSHSISISDLTIDDTVATYFITESSSAPTATAVWKSLTATPLVYETDSDGVKTLYAWAKDTAGNISLSHGQSTTVDTIAPVVEKFETRTSTNTLEIPITLTATDAVRVDSYQITASNIASTLTSADWKNPTPTTYTFPAGTTDGLKTLYAWAKDSAGHISVAKSTTITIDRAAPTILKVTSTKENGTYKAGELIPVTVEFSEPVVVTGTPTISLKTGTTDAVVNYTPLETLRVAPEGRITTLYFNYTVAAEQNSLDLDAAKLSGVIKDVAGNTATLTLPATDTETLAGTTNITIDTTAPTVSTFTAPAFSGSHSISVSDLTLNDAEATYLITESATPPATTATWVSLPVTPFVYATSSDGTKTLYAWAKDTVGNISLSRSRQIIVDTVAPVVDKFETRTSTNTLEIPITLTATDAVGVTGYQITASDTAPTLTSEDGSVEWKNPASTTYTFPTGTIDGLKTLYAWAKDEAGHISAVKSTTITIDRAAPSVATFTLPSATSRSRTINGISITTNNTDVTGYLITEAATSAIPGSPSATTDTWSTTPTTTHSFGTDGLKTLYAWVKDAAGNVSPAFTGRSIIIDSTAPVITTFTVPTPVNSLTIQNISLTATDTSGITGYIITDDSSTALATASTAWVTTGVPTSYTFPTGTLAGTKHLYAWVKDTAGNISLGSEKILEIDMTKPTTPPLPAVIPQTGVFEISSTNIETNTSSLSLKVACTPGDTPRVHYGFGLAVASAQPCSTAGYETLSVPLSTTAGYYNLYATTTDSAGNISDHSPAISLFKNPSATNSAPGTPDLDSTYDSGTSSTDNVTREARPILTTSCIAGSVVTLYDTNTAIGSATCMGNTVGSTAGTAQIMPTQDLSAGTHTITAKQRSSTGIVSLVSTALSLTIDTTPLTITLQKASVQSDPATSPAIRFAAAMSASIVASSLTCSDIIVTNGTCTSITSLSQNTYTITITATAPGAVNIIIPAGSVQTLAGNSNLYSNGVNTITYLVAPTKINGQCSSTLKTYSTPNPSKLSLSGQLLCTRGTKSTVSYNTSRREWTYTCSGTNGGTNATCTVGATFNSAPIEPDSTCDLKTVATPPFASCTIKSGTDFFRFQSYLSCLNIVAKKKSCTEAGCTQNAPRQELIYIAARLRGIPLESGYQCQKSYTDTTAKGVPSWVCEVAEKGQTAGLISKTNKTFRPLDTMSRAEAYSVLLKSICLHPQTTSKNWQTEVAKAALKEGFTTRTVTKFEPNKPILRQELYVLAARTAEWLAEHPDNCETLPDELICQ